MFKLDPWRDGGAYRFRGWRRARNIKGHAYGFRVSRMSEAISTRLPSQLVRMLEEEAKARGVSVSALLRELVEQRYGVKSDEREVQKPFLALLEKALTVQGESKMKSCPRLESCPFKSRGLEPSPVVCGVCQFHSHPLWPFPPLDYSPL